MCLSSCARCWLVAVFGCAIGLVGCSDPGRGGVEVSGTVTLDGGPMAAGSLVFVPLDSGHKAAGEIVDGTFRIAGGDGPIPGSYRVEVYAPQVSPVPLDDPLAYARSAPRVPQPNPVAPRYNRRSILKADVIADGVNEFVFQVESARR